MRGAVSLLAILLLTGCDRKDTVRRYRAPKDPSWRILAAIVPGPEGTWFFKVWGASDRLGPHQGEFLELIRTLRFENDRPVWTLPEGWRKEANGTLRFGRTEPKFELTSLHLAGDGGGIRANVNRWRGQLGASEWSEAELAQHAQVVNGATIVDLLGPRRPPDAGASDAETETSWQTLRGMFDFEAPQGWVEDKNPGENRLFEFRASEGKALITLSVLSGNGGGVGPNVNRWREQVGLPKVDEPEVERAKFLGREAWRVELTGKDRAILCTFLVGNSQAIFLKMDGPPDDVAREKSRYLAFSDSVRVKH